MASGPIASGSEGFEEWVETLDGYLAEITNSLPSGLGDLGSWRGSNSSAEPEWMAVVDVRARFSLPRMSG